MKCGASDPLAITTAINTLAVAISQNLDDDALAFAIYAVDGKMILNDGVADSGAGAAQRIPDHDRRAAQSMPE